MPSRSARVKGAPSARASEKSGAGSPAVMAMATASAEAELADQRAVPLEVLLLQIVQEPAAAADEHQEPAARVMVVLVLAQVLGQMVDSRGEHRDLHLGGARVARGLAELLDDLALFLRVNVSYAARQGSRRAAHTIAPGGLRRVQRVVGAAHQLLGRFALPRGPADADRDPRPRPTPVRSSSAAVGRPRVVVGEQREELLAAEAPELVLRAQVGAERYRHPDQHAVALGVPARVVDRLKVVDVDDGDGQRRPRGGARPLTWPASCVSTKRRLESPVSASSNRTASSRFDWATISSCSPFVRPAACTRVSSSASSTGSTRMSCAPCSSASTARSSGGAPSSTSSTAVPKASASPLIRSSSAAPGLGVHHGHVRLPPAAAVERVARGAALGHLVTRLRQHPLEPAPLTLPPMGYDNSHVR